MTNDPQKSVRIQFYVNMELKKEFYRQVIDKFGRTSGGAISEAGVEALKIWIGTEKAKEKRKEMYSAVGDGLV